MWITSSCPLAGKREDAPPFTLDLPIFPDRKPRSGFEGDLPASLAARSTLLRIGLFFFFLHRMSVRILAIVRTERNFFQRSEFSTGRFAFVFHPFLLQ